MGAWGSELSVKRKMSLVSWFTGTLNVSIPSWTIWLAIFVYFVNIKSTIFSWTLRFYALVGRHFYYKRLPHPIRLLLGLVGIPSPVKVLVEREQIHKLGGAQEKQNGNGNSSGGLESRVLKVLTTETPQPWELFGDHVYETYAPPVECDVNFHKSNSTYFTDLDIARTDLVCRVFKHALVEHRQKSHKWLYVALGSVGCVFKREIKPMQRYNIESRVLGWDNKWLVVRSRFVTKDGRHLLAVAVSKYVFKEQRKTVPPITVVEWSGFVTEENRNFINQTAAQGFKTFQSSLEMEGALTTI